MSPPPAAKLTADPNGVAWVRARGPAKTRLALGRSKAHPIRLPPRWFRFVLSCSLALFSSHAPTHAIPTPLASTQRSAGLLRTCNKIYTNDLLGKLVLVSSVGELPPSGQPQLNPWLLPTLFPVLRGSSHPSIMKTDQANRAAVPCFPSLLGPLGLAFLADRVRICSDPRVAPRAVLASY
ncbi:uncharacterized protein BJX67DRAFT_82189 [Aspergillus lucknowensis]|uniref:Uncharacterized protein n=1 Tax=Aspergillus lucknowensis TaxID=176173 RepID=A0ABR4LRZ1_9EURO